ncbi:MAG: tetratricopeptide repeat protein [Elusimicrobiaceae bacterium]|nr:tetratricopeptide repeat protein [Elusimicrobiaceae bacterium]
MYWKNKFIFLLPLILFTSGCASFQNGFLGLAPAGDKKAYVRAREAYSNGNYQQAIEELSTYIYKTKNVRRREARAYRLLGKSYEERDRLNEALEVYSEALEFHPNNVPLLIAAAELYQRTGLRDQSQQLFKRALAQEPGNLQALSGLAHNYYLVGFDSKAQEIYNRFFELNPTAGPLYRARYAQTFLHQHDYEQAFIHSTMALMQQPDNSEFWLLHARAAHGLNLSQEALESLETALNLSPNARELLSTKALWLYQDKEFEKALQTAQQILKQKPHNQLAHLVIALCQYQKKRINSARRELQQIIQLDPDTFVGKVAQGILTQLQ